MLLVSCIKVYTHSKTYVDEASVLLLIIILKIIVKAILVIKNDLIDYVCSNNNGMNQTNYTTPITKRNTQTKFYSLNLESVFMLVTV